MDFLCKYAAFFTEACELKSNRSDSKQEATKSNLPSRLIKIVIWSEMLYSMLLQSEFLKECEF